MPKISYASCLGLSLAILAQFTLKMCVAVGNCKKNSLKTLILGSRSFKVIDVDTSKKLVTIACYDKQHVCLSATVFTLHEIIVVK